MQQPFESLLRQTRQQTLGLLDLPAGIAQGRLRRVSGLMLEVEGLALTVGARAHVQALGSKPWVEAECTGFDGGISYLMALDEMQSLAPGAAVLPSTMPRLVDGRYAMLPGLAGLPVCDQLLGRVVDGLGRPLDGLGAGVDRHRQQRPSFINPLKRRPIDTPLDTGVRAINAALTVGRGQRIGLFAGSGVGKSVLLSMLARNCQADVVVIALVGERSREVREFCDDYFLHKARERSVVVAAPADHDRQFTLVIDAIAPEFARQHDRVAGMLERAGVLQEEHRVGRGRRPALGGVLLVVESDAEDVPRFERREQLLDGGAGAGVAERPEQVPLEQRRVAVVVEAAEVFAAGGEEADDFHGDRQGCAPIGRRCRG